MGDDDTPSILELFHLLYFPLSKHHTLSPKSVFPNTAFLAPGIRFEEDVMTFLSPALQNCLPITLADIQYAYVYDLCLRLPLEYGHLPHRIPE